MKAVFRWRAFTTDPNTGEEISVPADLDGWSYREDRLENYLDSPLAEAGVIGGEFRAAVQDGKAEVLLDFWYPGSMPADLLDLLRENAIGQVSDGMGEGGFLVDRPDGPVQLEIDEDEMFPLEIVQDGRVLPGPPRIAIAARDGDLPALKQAIDDGAPVDQPLLGFTGLYYAISGQHLAAARLLIDAGADPNLTDVFGHSPLHLCADSRSLSDADACELAEQLLLRGADPTLPTAAGVAGPGGDLAVEYAEKLGKTRLVELLKRR